MRGSAPEGAEEFLVATTTTSAAPVAAKQGRLLRIVKWLFLLALLLIVAAAICGAAYQVIATYRDGQRFPQEGRSVALGAAFPGVSLNMNCSGTVAGAPTVIMDTGLGVPAVGWDFVQPDVAKFARVCSYDRAGYGWSTPGPMPRTSGEIAKELHALLTAAGEKPPYVLVAHSFGGYNVRVYTKEYPAEVAGMVLVDTSHEDQNNRMPGTLKNFMKKQSEQLEIQRKLAPYLMFFGIARLIGGEQDPTGKLPKDFLKKVNYLSLQTKFVEATASEIGSFETSAAEVKGAGNLGDRPLVVLTAGKSADPKLLPGIDKKDIEELQKIWINDLQVQEMHLSTRGTRQIVEDSTHMIPFERPDTVILAIRAVCEAVKNAATAAAPNSPAASAKK
jgi:pimeloyl-ACP methyl ester carboxylesterase